MKQIKNDYLSDFIIEKQSLGQYSFTLQQLRASFNVSYAALHQALKRLIKKKKICSVRRNFYVIIPPEYLSQGMLPPTHFIDDLMKFAGKPYYVGLLNAAGFYGSSHQQPQEFFVMTIKPVLRTISVRGVIIHFVIRKKIHSELIQQRDTQTGFLQVSGPVLTALDCVISADRIGGTGRAWEIIQDIVPAFSKLELKGLLHKDVPLPAIQRLGTLLDSGEKSRTYGDILFNACAGHTFRQVLLSPSRKDSKGRKNRWHVIENIDIEGEE